MKKSLDYLLLILLIGVLIIASSCTKEEVIEDIPSPQLNINGNLPIDANGYYHLIINRDTNQTIHTISGHVDNWYYYESLKVDWDSNLVWYFNDEPVPTTNKVSYVMEGNVQNVIAPTKNMIGDTLTLKGKIWYSDESSEWAHDKIKIVLD